MNSQKTLFAILGGVALSAGIGILLTSYRDSSKRKEIFDKARDYTDTAKETIKDSAAGVKKELKKMGEDAERMVNEGGNTT
ncbi:hypothetical protein CK503_04740 [Aliifodinibius salipaludis]|uniref:YtxH domain-containing protein n=1 Tax=Fodinibius salipaludis TaxID=2032627 RepID=A0A2A2GAL1_9BACT|nr:YtxH domain-containing protein [Aliifodinibius salipaludis]PAU94786.1 hypothetical protein CK503_04740 [Aliifodinibius salipaludis]